MEKAPLIFEQDKTVQSSSFAYEDDFGSDNEARRKSLYEKLISQDGLAVKIIKKDHKGNQTELTVVFKFSFNKRLVLLQIVEPTTNNIIGYIDSEDLAPNMVTNIFKYYGSDDITLDRRVANEYEQAMKEKYSGKGVMKAAFACFQLALEENGFNVTTGFTSSQNLSAIRSREVPNLVNLSFSTKEDTLNKPKNGNNVRLITTTTRT